MTEPLTAAPWAVRAFVKRGGQWDCTGDSTLTADWIGPVSGEVRGLVEREMEERALPDAFGAVMVPGADRALLPGDWAVTDLGDQLLARHSDPAAWYGRPRPDVRLVNSTREALGPLVRVPDRVL